MHHLKWHHWGLSKTTCSHPQFCDHTMRLSTFRRTYLHIAAKWSNWKCTGPLSWNTSRYNLYTSFVKQVNMIQYKQLFNGIRMVKVKLLESVLILRMRDHTYMFYKYVHINLACLSWPAWTEIHITFTWIHAQPSMTDDSTQHAWRLTGKRYLVLQLPVFVQSEVQLAIKSISINVSSIHLVFNMQSNTDTLISWYLLVLLKKVHFSQHLHKQTKKLQNCHWCGTISKDTNMFCYSTDMYLQGIIMIMYHLGLNKVQRYTF